MHLYIKYLNGHVFTGTMQCQKQMKVNQLLQITYIVRKNKLRWFDYVFSYKFLPDKLSHKIEKSKNVLLISNIEQTRTTWRAFLNVEFVRITI